MAKIDREELLFEVCRSGPLSAVQEVLDEHYSPGPDALNFNSPNADTTPPYKGMLLEAVKTDNSPIVRYCLEHGAHNTCAVLTRAHLSGAVHSLKEFIIWREEYLSKNPTVDQDTIDRASGDFHQELPGLDINSYLSFSGTPLMIAAQEGNAAIVQFLLEHGAWVNGFRFDHRMTTLSSAVWAEVGLDVVIILLDYGADVKGSGAVVVAAENGDQEMVKLLLRTVQEREEKLEKLKSECDDKAKTDQIGDKEKGEETVLAVINEPGLEDCCDDRRGESFAAPLHKAVHKRDEEMVKLLLSWGAREDVQDGIGRTVLELVRESDWKEGIKLLEEKAGNDKQESE